MLRWAVGFFDHLTHARFLWAISPDRLVKNKYTAHRDSLFHFSKLPIRHCWWSLLRQLVSWCLKNLRISFAYGRYWTDLGISNWTTDVKDSQPSTWLVVPHFVHRCVQGIFNMLLMFTGILNMCLWRQLHWMVRLEFTYASYRPEAVVQDLWFSLRCGHRLC